ncbi:uncharacterized protein LOC121242426 [Juglans microcarpa x Juglans regia]|uniref:uncharacterized protein LOC121242426 n=1 Tax=Juglans microcarpa x Juglans regia TaxID=2249226 RepID=UPI001B7DECEE|nr:uncharacterized protein LOC121242426 [Juglans microcarpa x Juglans regia]
MSNEGPSNAAPPTISPSEDQKSPFYFHHSDNANIMVVTCPLTDPNYLSWHRSFTLAIFVKNKLGFLDGSISTPDLTDSLYIPWLRCNNLILSWLLNSISKEIASNVLYISSAKDVWEKLKTRFAQPNNVRIYHLQQQLGTIMQGTHIELDYVFKFLMGLNDTYDHVRGKIILMSPMPSLDKTLSLVLQEERLWQIRTLVMPVPEPSALAIFNGNSRRKERS